MKLSIVFPVMNQFPIARTAIGQAVSNLSGEIDSEVIVLDNGSEVPFLPYGEKSRDMKLAIKRAYNFSVKNDTVAPPAEREATATLKTRRHEKSIGVYPTFWDSLKIATGDIIAFFHSDVMIAEKDWDKRVIAEFEKDPTLGMIGFIGSNEIDGSGGRGLGTTSNFQGNEYSDHDGLGNVKTWKGSPAHVHGKHSTGFSPASVVDGCVMIFRRSVLEGIKQRENFPPHHFYDRLLSCEVREHGFKMGVLGVAFDHISGQTVNQEPAYDDMARQWCEARGLSKEKEGVHNWDSVIYREAERQWLKEYRDDKKLVPCRV